MALIAVSRSKVKAQVDNDLLPVLLQYKWHLSTKGYAIANARDNKNKRTTISMHRLVLITSQQIDHINRDKLDNRRVNLSAYDASQNKANTVRHKDSSSGYKGVMWHKRDKKWRTAITCNYKKYYLGYFDNKLQAAQAYDLAAVKFFGRFAKLNLGGEI